MLPTTSVVGFPPRGFGPRLDHSKARWHDSSSAGRKGFFRPAYSNPAGDLVRRGYCPHKGGTIASFQRRWAVSGDFNSRWTPLTSRPQTVARSGVASFVPECRLPPSRWQVGRSVRGRITAARITEAFCVGNTVSRESLSGDKDCETVTGTRSVPVGSQNHTVLATPANSRRTQAEIHVGFLPRMKSWVSTSKFL